MIRSAPFAVFLVMLAFPMAMTGILVFAGLHARRRAALSRNTHTASLAFVNDGYHQFEGRAEALASGSVRTALTKMPCVWYHARVQKLVPQRGSRESHWETVRDVTSAAPFLIRDGSGAATVYPHGAEVTPTDRSRWYGDSAQPADLNPPRLKATESVTPMVDIAGSHKFLYFEERIYEGDPLTVLGTLKRQRPSEPVEDDDDQDGEGNEEGLTAEDALDARLEQLAAKASSAKIVKGSRKQPLVIAATTREQHAELTALGGKAAFGVALAPLALVALLLWARFG